MPHPHSGHTATLLDDGTVLLAGGYFANCGGTITSNNVDLYDPTLGMGGGWGPTTHMWDARQYHAACLLQDGKVLVSGGTNFQGTALTASELYDPVAKTWSFTAGSMANARENHQCVTLDDGTVLVAGGNDGLGNALNSAEIYDPVAKTWSPTSAMATGRTFHAMLPIPGGQVMAVGGYNGADATYNSTEIYDPASKTWSAGPTMSVPRQNFTVTALGNTLLAAGGWVGNTATATSELLDFGLPNGSPCGVASACSSGFCTAGLCCDSACTATCTACTAALKGTGMDGTCGPVAKGQNPGNVCVDQGPATCGTDGYCDGAGACGRYPDGTVCLEPTPCIVAVCAHGTCGGPNKLDGSPCPGGICIAGACVPDPNAGTGSSSSGASTGSTSSSSASSGGSTTAASSTGTGGMGQGGQPPVSARLEGSGCGVAPSRAPAPGPGLIAVMLGLVAAWRKRRRAES
jgi:MYXO-CTERM domain-containing protein